MLSDRQAAFAKAEAGNLAHSPANRSRAAAKLRPAEPKLPKELKVGAGDGNRTHDIQLGS
jgi:hypothetical protein